MAQGILDGKGLPGAIPEWLLGWWSVYDTNQYYYYFYDGGEVVYTEKQPTPKSLPQKIGNTGSVTMTEHGLDIRWRPRGGGLPTIEQFTRMGWSSTTEMFGTSNKYGGLSARKIV